MSKYEISHSSEQSAGVFTRLARQFTKLFNTPIEQNVQRISLEQKGTLLFDEDDLKWKSFQLDTYNQVTDTDINLRKHAAVFICTMKFALAYMEGSTKAYSDDESDPTQIPNHPVRELLRKPNPEMSEAEFNTMKGTYLAIQGNCFIHKLYNKDGIIVGLRPYSIVNMIPKLSLYSSGAIEYYTYKAHPREQGEIIPVEHVIHCKWPIIDPQNPAFGMIPLMAVKAEADIDREITRYTYALLKNDAVPRGIISIPARERISDPGVAERIRKAWRQRNGGDNRGDIEVLPDGATYERIAATFDELASDALRAVPEARIPAAWGMDAIYAGLTVGLERATYSNFSDSRRKFYETFILPFWNLDSDQMTQGLSEDFKELAEPFQLKRDTSMVGALKQDINALRQSAALVYEKGLVTLDEGRAIIALPPVPDGSGGKFFEPPAQPQGGTEKTPTSTPKPIDNVDDDGTDEQSTPVKPSKKPKK